MKTFVVLKGLFRTKVFFDEVPSIYEATLRKNKTAEKLGIKDPEWNTDYKIGLFNKIMFSHDNE